MTDRVRKYRYSEIFGKTIQGEGHYCGVPTIWVRFWGCNFNCSGFLQDNPEDPSTYDLAFEKIDPTQYKSMEELPVFDKGCDSSYSWAQKFAHLAHQGTAAEICDKLVSWLPGGTFLHPVSKQEHHLAFTGGEPMMSQTAIVDIMEEFERRGNVPKFVTIETNGTQMPRQPFKSMVQKFQDLYGVEFFFSVSPKLYLSGEMWAHAIKPEVLQAYRELSPAGQLKYVCNGTDRAWDEVKKATDLYREVGVEWPVWIMPVGATKEAQENHQAIITEQAVERGYSVAARVHSWIFANVIGK